MTTYAGMHEIDAPGNANWSVSGYGPELQANKEKLRMACERVGASWELRVLLLATGFQETTSLSSRDRDASKDHSGPSANVSAWNLSLDLVQQVGSYAGDPWDLNREDRLDDVVRTVRDGIDKWGVNRYLNFVRGGRTAFDDGHSYGAHDFRNSIKTMCGVIHGDHSLMWDDRRVNVDLVHV